MEAKDKTTLLGPHMSFLWNKLPSGKVAVDMSCQRNLRSMSIGHDFGVTDQRAEQTRITAFACAGFQGIFTDCFGYRHQIVRKATQNTITIPRRAAPSPHDHHHHHHHNNKMEREENHALILPTLVPWTPRQAVTFLCLGCVFVIIWARRQVGPWFGVRDWDEGED
ncbi:hypothetical protein IQ06DRAFT_299241 [Phaeosphaeriaceae sp. SRC1lsM3a]|nr:hypothetical protein IQ06DRAFT_299241 [Stagonospora sp. SRC1lsM3a]